MYETSRMQTMPKRLGRIQRRENKRLFMSKVSDEVIKVITSAIATAVIGTELVKYTLDKRGYFAVGGEWIMMIMVFIAVYTFLGKKKANPKRWSASRKVSIPSSLKNIKESGR